MTDIIRFLFAPSSDLAKAKLRSCPHYMFDQYVHALLECNVGDVKISERFSKHVKGVGSAKCKDLLVYQTDDYGRIVDMDDEHLDLFLGEA